MTRSLRARAHRASVVVTGGGVPVAMTGDEARAFARLLADLANQVDPISYERGFGELHTPDVPAPPVPDIRPGAINRVDTDGFTTPELDELRARVFAKIPLSAVLPVSRFLDDAAPAIAALNAIELEEHHRRLQVYGVSTYRTDEAGRINLVDVDR